MMITLKTGQQVLIDNSDIELISRYKWKMSKTGYAMCLLYIGKQNGRSKYKRIWMHRLIMDCPNNMQVDHINHNKLDNRRNNLRVCTIQQNAMNRKPRNRYKGVRKHSIFNTYSAVITTPNGKIDSINGLNTEDEAAQAYDSMAIHYFKEFAHLNFPNNTPTPYNPKQARPLAKRYVGVCWHSKRNRWAAYINIDGKRKNIGLFKTEIDAAKAYDRWAVKYRGKDTKVNFPDMKVVEDE